MENINKTYRKGAIGALIDEYERAILDLSQTISDFSDVELITIIDGQDARCESVQATLAHVVRAGYSYASYVRQISGEQGDFREMVFRNTISEFQKDMTDFLIFTENSFKNITDQQLEENDNQKKIMTSWGQLYDIEQIMEHAIVHILRHRRQLEKFKILLRNTTNK
ncbi:DinB family protein [Flavobacterium branchiicola]|uniref:DinB family protein n=1 Tax=Flavobacterium branchiicola TaxID=1114875 RepID=A0ABV9PGW9_9FLAO|nr:DinB family protein [Flavobacterium branchiicola]MBS7255846.1 DinB family protein [Flavobacterium branchiicola]